MDTESQSEELTESSEITTQPPTTDDINNQDGIISISDENVNVYVQGDNANVVINGTQVSESMENGGNANVNVHIGNVGTNGVVIVN